MNKEMEIESLKEELEKASDPYTYEPQYRNMLNENPVIIGSCTYDTAATLEEIDPIAYRCGLMDFADALIEENTLDIEKKIKIKESELVDLN
jgi:hypothetical protein